MENKLSCGHQRLTDVTIARDVPPGIFPRRVKCRDCQAIFSLLEDNEREQLAERELAAKDKRIAELEAENARLRADLNFANIEASHQKETAVSLHSSLRCVGGELAEDRTLNKLLAQCETACREFVGKVERGEARSRRSYAEMKAALAAIDAARKAGP